MIDALLPPIAPPAPASHGAPANAGRDDFSQALDAAQRRPDAAAEGPTPAEGGSGETRTSDTDAAAPDETEHADNEDRAASPPVDLSALLPGWPPSPPADAAAPADGAAVDGAALDATAAGTAPRAAKPAPDFGAALPDGSLPSTHDPKALIKLEPGAVPDAAGRAADLPATAQRTIDHATPLSMPLAAAPAGTLQNTASTTPTAPFQAHLAAAVDSPAFAPSLGATLSLLARDGVQQAQLTLHPAELGPVAVQIAVDGTQARVDFHAAHAATRAALEAALPDLAAALRDSGLTLAGGGVFDQSPKRQAEQAQDGRREGPARDDEQIIKHTPQLSRPRGVVDLYA